MTSAEKGFTVEKHTCISLFIHNLSYDQIQLLVLSVALTFLHHNVVSLVAADFGL